MEIKGLNMLKVESLQLAYNGNAVVNDITLSFGESSISTIIGPNGSGKSTILKAFARLLKPSGGLVLLDGKDIHRMPTKVVAQRMALLPQNLSIPEDVTVKELVSYGRMPHRGLLLVNERQDKEAIQWAISLTGLEPLAHRTVISLSGGERQRAWIAMALAQKTEFLLLDEPTTFLDLHHQIEILQLLGHLNERYSVKVIMVLHDINHAIRFSNRVIVINEGMICSDGPPEEVITEGLLQDVFKIKAKILRIEESGQNIMVFIPYGCLNNDR